jgi:hypothetical protein
MPILNKFTNGFLSSRPEGAALAGVRDSVGLEDVSGRVCGASGCHSSWMKPWKSRRRPVFDDEWGCSPKCLLEMVGNAVRREVGDGFDGLREEPHRHRVPLGLVLLAQGWITQPQLQSALAAQRASGEGRIGEWLTKHCGLPEDRIARGLGVQWNCPVLSLNGFSARQMALVMPKRFVAEFGLVPVRTAGSTMLYVAFQDRLQPSAALGLEQMCGLRVESGLLTETQLESARTRVLASESVSVRMRMVGDSDEMTAAIVKLIEQKQPVKSRLVRMEHYFWFRLWKEDGAFPAIGGLQSTIEDTEDHVFLMKV